MQSAIILAFILAGAYAGYREGIFTMFCTFLNVFIAGFVSFNFFEPLVAALEPSTRGSFLAGYEDFLVLSALFIASFMALRIVTNNLALRFLEFRSPHQQFGGAGFGVLAGYFVGGFFLCTLQTLPWHENFLEFTPRTENESGLRSLWPSDRVWLAMMRYAGANGLSWKEADPLGLTRYDRYETFDREGTFELRYQRYRRHGDNRAPLPYSGELDDVLRKK